jgi:hypothetical protein
MEPVKIGTVGYGRTEAKFIYYGIDGESQQEAYSGKTLGYIDEPIKHIWTCDLKMIDGIVYIEPSMSFSGTYIGNLDAFNQIAKATGIPVAQKIDEGSMQAYQYIVVDGSTTKEQLESMYATPQEPFEKVLEQAATKLSACQSAQPTVNEKIMSQVRSLR